MIILYLQFAVKYEGIKCPCLKQMESFMWGNACELAWWLTSFHIMCMSNHPVTYLNVFTIFSIMLHKATMPERHFQSLIVNDDAKVEKRFVSVDLMSLLEVSPYWNLFLLLNLIWCQMEVKHICLSCSRCGIRLRNPAGDYHLWRNQNPQED